MGAMEIFVVRHGVAEPVSATADAERSLSRAGKHVLRRQVRLWKKLGLRAEACFCSPLLRTRQTADILRIGGFYKGKKVITEDLAPGTNSERLITFLSQLSYQHVVLVGHNPSLPRFCQSALNGPPIFDMAPGTLVHLRWNDAHHSPLAELLGLIRPYDLP